MISIDHLSARKSETSTDQLNAQKSYTLTSTDHPAHRCHDSTVYSTTAAAAACARKQRKGARFGDHTRKRPGRAVSGHEPEKTRVPRMPKSGSTSQGCFRCRPYVGTAPTLTKNAHMCFGIPRICFKCQKLRPKGKGCVQR